MAFLLNGSSDIFSDGIFPLVEKGMITGEHKVMKKGKIVTCFAVGSHKLYNFIDDNHMLHFKEAAYTNDSAIIRRNLKVTAINSAIKIDITGQVCADTHWENTIFWCWGTNGFYLWCFFI
jgi:acyl-CoA hydrolase